MSVIRHVYGQDSDGHVVCSCGAKSPQRFGTIARAREWHRGHKATARLERECDAWNAAHPVGSPIMFWPATRDVHGTQSRTRTPAWVIPSGAVLVSVEGYAGGIALSHVDPIEAGGSGG